MLGGRYLGAFYHSGCVRVDELRSKGLRLAIWENECVK